MSKMSEHKSADKAGKDPLLRKDNASQSDEDSDCTSHASSKVKKDSRGHEAAQGQSQGQGQNHTQGQGSKVKSDKDRGKEAGSSKSAQREDATSEHHSQDHLKVKEDKGHGSKFTKHKRGASFSSCSLRKELPEVIFGPRVSRSGEFLPMKSRSVPPSESGDSLRNGRILISPPSSASLTSSGPKHTIVLEEVAPSMSSIIDDQTDWRMSVDIFSARRRGKQREDKELPRSVRRYYKTQDELITAFEELHLEVDDAMENTEDQARAKQYASILSKVSFFANLLLLIAKAVAAGLSGSLAVISSVIDSVVDLVSGALMWWSNRAIKQRDIYLYPQGRTKLEPLAIVILSVVMALASVQMIRESIEKIIYYATHEGGGPVFQIVSIAICGFTIVMKFVLFLLCRRVKTSSTQALAQDHRNDVLSNSVALGCGYIGYKFWNFADPIGALIISVYIIFSWSVTGKEQIKMLTGHTARPDFLKKITWLALNHHQSVMLIDTVRAFHFGNNFLVEVDIVLPEEMSLRESHDIGEALQNKIERLPEVERAFVHLDYECEHGPFSEHKQV